MQQMKFEAFLPDFSGFSGVWASLVSEPQHKAAEEYSKPRPDRDVLDAQEYLAIFEQLGVAGKQRTMLAEEFHKIFGIHLAVRLGFPHGLQFAKYDCETDRILTSIPFPTILRLLRMFAPDDFEPLQNLYPGDQDAWTEPAVAACVGRLDRTFLCSLLEAAAKRSIEKRELARMSREADRVFGQSVDWDRLQSMTKARRREKRQAASAPAFNGLAFR